MQNLSPENEHYKEKYRIPSARMEGWDYGSNGLYYVTICTLNRVHYFGEIALEDHTDRLGGETQNIASLQPESMRRVALNTIFCAAQQF